MPANKKYKDSVFTLLFNDKQKLIELYNAIKGTNYSEDADLVITTLEDALYMTRKNDISFTIDGKYVILFEHQSSINPNMLLRFLIYIARVYEKIIDNKAIFREQQIKIPTPEFVVLYNGRKDFPEKKVLKLSDAFKEYGIDNINLEITVQVLNINYGKSAAVLGKSRTLEDYSYFVYLVNQNMKHGIELEDSIKTAIKQCLKEDRMSQFLKLHGSEVVNMLNTEFNLEDAKEVWQEEAREEARAEERSKIAISLLGLLEDEIIAEKTGLSLAQIKELKNTP